MGLCGRAGAQSEEIQPEIVPGNIPTATITVPSPGTEFRGGQEIRFAGTGADLEDGQLPVESLSWEVDYIDGNEVTLIMPRTEGVGRGAFVVPDGVDSVRGILCIRLSVTDSDGNVETTEMQLSPEVAPVTLVTAPFGLDLEVGGSTVSTPVVVPAVVGTKLRVKAGSRKCGETSFTFDSWDSGREEDLIVSIGFEEPTYVAMFESAGPLSKAGWTIHGFSSEETDVPSEDGSASNAIDGDLNTFWHTEWSQADPDPSHPHYLQVDLGASYNVCGFRYLPRQDLPEDNGRINAYEFRLSTDGTTWGAPVASGNFPDTSIQQEVNFTSQSARYVEIRALSEHNPGGPYTSIAELDILEDSGVVNEPPDGTILAPSADITVFTGDYVNFMGSGADPENNTPLTYLWVFPAASGIANQYIQNPGTLQFNTPGTFLITMTVSDGFGLPDPSPATVTVEVLSHWGAPISQTGWSLHYVDSVDGSDGGDQAFDGDIDTMWHTASSSPRPFPPHEIQIDLGANYDVNGFRYLPRQDRVPNGRIGDYEFYLSTDGNNWGNPVATGRFPDSMDEQKVFFPPQTARYIRLQALDEVNGSAYTSVAEINVLHAGASANTAPTASIDFPTGNETIVAGSAIDFRGSGSDGDGDTPLSFRWSVETGSRVVDQLGDEPEIVRFNEPGVYEVSLRTVDSRGLAVSTPVTCTITVVGGSNVISNNGWTVEFVDSEETSSELAPGSNAIDGNPSTFWHSEYSGASDPPHPHEIQVDMGSVHDVGGFRYLPRQDGFTNGRVSGFRFFVSMDGVTWGPPVAYGEFADDDSLKTVEFAAKRGQFVRFQSVSEVDGNLWASMAELDVLEATPVTPSVSIREPASGYLQVDDSLRVVVDAALAAGQGVLIQLDGGPGQGGSEVQDYSLPFETTFVLGDTDPHTVDAFVIDGTGTVVESVGAHDRVVNVGVGDAFLAFGDSIFWGEGDNDETDDDSVGFRNIGGGFTPIFGGLVSTATGRPAVIVNEGIPGAKSPEGIVTLPRVLQENPGVLAVLLMLGTNDTGSTLLPTGLGLSPGQAGYAGSYKSYLQRMIDDINSAGKLPIIMRLPMIIDSMHGGSPRDPVVQQFNLVVDELAAIPANNIVIAPPDLYAATVAAGSSEYADAFHPNGQGYKTMAATIYAAIGGMIPATVVLDDLVHVFDGTSKGATAITTPTGLSVDITYNGSETEPTAMGDYSVSAVIDDASFEGSTTGTLEIVTAIDFWRYTHFGSTDNSGDGADSFDFDNDGMINLLEYAMGLDPRVPGPSPVTYDVVGGFLTITAPKNPDATDVTFSAESGPSPGSLSAATTALVSETPTMYQARDTVAITAGTKRFIAVRVTGP